jgi:hypothetical protein
MKTSGKIDLRNAHLIHHVTQLKIQIEILMAARNVYLVHRVQSSNNYSWLLDRSLGNQWPQVDIFTILKENLWT